MQKYELECEPHKVVTFHGTDYYLKIKLPSGQVYELEISELDYINMQEPLIFTHDGKLANEKR